MPSQVSGVARARVFGVCGGKNDFGRVLSLTKPDLSLTL